VDREFPAAAGLRAHHFFSKPSAPFRRSGRRSGHPENLNRLKGCATRPESISFALRSPPPKCYHQFMPCPLKGYDSENCIWLMR
jgi:hypothetical protein